MSSPVGSRLGDAGDRRMVRGLAAGDPRVIVPLMDRHMGRVYGLLRLLLATGAEAEAATGETFAAAIERARLDAPPQRAVADWLVAIAVEQVEHRVAAGPPPSPNGSAATAGPAGTATSSGRALDGVSDAALGVLIRTLGLRERRALVLSVVLGLPDSRVAPIAGCDPGDVRKHLDAGVAAVLAKLEHHQEVEQELARQIAAVPYRLRPLGGGAGRGPAGNTVVVGTSVHLEAPHHPNILSLIRQILKRLARGIRRRHDETGLDDEAGSQKKGKAPDPTPTLQPYEKPKATPSLRGYKTPKLSPGVAVYAMPRTTPTTRRLTNRSRPLPPRS